jgi:hypothetical protein
MEQRSEESRSNDVQSLFTVNQYSNKERSFTPASLRNLIFKAEPRVTYEGEIPGNGLIECGAIIRVGRKVLIDDHKFLEWLGNQNPGGNNE